MVNCLIGERMPSLLIVFVAVGVLVKMLVAATSKVCSHALFALMACWLGYV